MKYHPVLLLICHLCAYG